MLKEKYLDNYNAFLNKFHVRETFEFQNITIYKNPDEKTKASTLKSFSEENGFMSAEDVFGNHYVWENTLAEESVRQFLNTKCENMLLPKDGADADKNWEEKVSAFMKTPRWVIDEYGNGIETMGAPIGWIHMDFEKGECDLYMGKMDVFVDTFDSLEKAMEAYTKKTGFSPLSPFNQFVSATVEFNHLLTASVYVPDALKEKEKNIHLRDNGYPMEAPSLLKNEGYCRSSAETEKVFNEYALLPQKAEAFRREYITGEINNAMYNFYKEGGVGNVLYHNATGYRTVSGFVDEVLPLIDLSQYADLPKETIDSRLQKIFNNPEKVFKPALMQFVKNDHDSLFSFHDSSMLSDASFREEMDFSDLGLFGDGRFSVEKVGNGALRVENVLENTLDEIAFLTPALKSVMELNQNMRIMMPLDVDRVKEEMSARLLIVVDKNDSDSEILEVPFELRQNEKDWLTAFIETQLGEPLKVSERDLKKNSFLEVKYKEGKSEKSHAETKDKTRSSLKKNMAEKTDMNR